MHHSFYRDIFSLALAFFYSAVIKSSRKKIKPFIPLPRFFNSRRVSPLLNQSLVLIPQQSPSAAHDVCYVQIFTDLLYIIVSSVTFFP